MQETTIHMITKIGPTFINFDTYKNGELILIQRVYPEETDTKIKQLTAKAVYDMEVGIPTSTIISELKASANKVKDYNLSRRNFVNTQRRK